MPNNIKTRDLYSGNTNRGDSGVAVLTREGDHATFEIPIEWIPPGLDWNVMLEVTTNNSDTVTFERVDAGPSASTSVEGGS